MLMDKYKIMYVPVNKPTFLGVYYCFFGGEEGGGGRILLLKVDWSVSSGLCVSVSVRDLLSLGIVGNKFLKQH